MLLTFNLTSNFNMKPFGAIRLGLHEILICCTLEQKGKPALLYIEYCFNYDDTLLSLMQIFT